MCAWHLLKHVHNNFILSCLFSTVSSTKFGVIAQQENEFGHGLNRFDDVNKYLFLAISNSLPDFADGANEICPINSNSTRN